MCNVDFNYTEACPTSRLPAATKQIVSNESSDIVRMIGASKVGRAFSLSASKVGRAFSLSAYKVGRAFSLSA